jgi:hypothetical protein
MLLIRQIANGRDMTENRAELLRRLPKKEADALFDLSEKGAILS